MTLWVKQIQQLLQLPTVIFITQLFSKFLSEDMATIISNAMYKDLYIEICTPYAS